MHEIKDWQMLSDEDKILISKFAVLNNAAVREMMRNRFPSLYIGRGAEEVARGWVMIAGLSEVKKFISDFVK